MRVFLSLLFEEQENRIFRGAKMGREKRLHPLVARTKTSFL